MEFLEKDLEDIIFETDNCDLQDRGLIVHSNKKRQVRIGNYGIADIVSWARDYNVLYIDVMELKKDYVNNNTFMQAIRYAKGIERYFQKRRPNIKVLISITLVGRYVDLTQDVCFLPDIIKTTTEGIISIYTYNYTALGIEFTEIENLSLTNEGF